MDNEWERFEKLANRNLLEPSKDSPPTLHILDIFSWAMTSIFMIGLIKKI